MREVSLGASMTLKSYLNRLRTEVDKRLGDYGVLTDLTPDIKGKQLYRQWEIGFSCTIPEMTFLKGIVRSDDIVFDVGANIGEFTFFLSTIVLDGVIHAFEPQLKPFRVLRGVCHNIRNAHAHMMGFSSSSGEATLFIPIIDGHASPSEASVDPHFNDFSGYERRPKATGSVTETIQLITLDEFFEREALDRLDFAKIDVEGHELEILRGGSRVCLKKQRPVFLIEVFPYVYKGYWEAVCEYLATHDYVALVLTGDGFSLEPLTLRNANNSPGFNYFFVPHEKTKQISHLLGRL